LNGAKQGSVVHLAKLLRRVCALRSCARTTRLNSLRVRDVVGVAVLAGHDGDIFGHV
jgi:hypothetical protein